MRILVTGRAIPHQPNYCTGQRLVEGFKQAGHDCIFYGNFYGEPYRWLGVQETSTQKFDIIIVTEMNDGYPGYELNYINLNDVPTLYWDFDVSYNSEVSLRGAAQYNASAYLVANKYYLDEFRRRFNKPVLHLPYACSPEWQKPTKAPKEYLIGFVGSINDERKRLIQLIEKLLYNRAAITTAEGIYGDKLIELTCKMRIMFHRNQEACRGLVAGRPWETAACDTTLIMDRVAYEDFIEFLPKHLHEDIIMYDNDDDIRRLIIFWQDRPMQLELMGRCLGEYIRNNHSYRQRANQIIEFAKTERLI